METIALILHGLTLLFVLGIVAHSYLMGFNWMRGKVEKLDEKKVTRHHFYAWRGIALMIITGVAAFWSHHTEFMAKWQFHTKMGLIIVLIINCIVINRLMKVGSMSSWRSLTSKQKLPIILSATVATLCWAGILLAAMFIGIDEK